MIVRGGEGAALQTGQSSMGYVGNWESLQATGQECDCEEGK